MPKEKEPADSAQSGKSEDCVEDVSTSQTYEELVYGLTADQVRAAFPSSLQEATAVTVSIRSPACTLLPRPPTVRIHHIATNHDP